RIGMMTQATPVASTTSAWLTYLGSSRLIAVSVTMVLIPSRAMSARRTSGSCQAPRTNRPGTTTRTRFSALPFPFPSAATPQRDPSTRTSTMPAPRHNRTTLRQHGQRVMHSADDLGPAPHDPLAGDSSRPGGRGNPNTRITAQEGPGRTRRTDGYLATAG